MLKEQAKRTPPPQWVGVVGGWNEFQFAERRMPTPAGINAVPPDTPVFILHLYDRAILNAAALRAVGYDKNTPDLAVLSADYFAVPEEEIKGIQSVLTVAGGKVVYAAEPFAGHGPPPLPVTPDWSPVATYGGYHAGVPHTHSVHCSHGSRPHGLLHRLFGPATPTREDPFWGTGGCSCWAF